MKTLIISLTTFIVLTLFISQKAYAFGEINNKYDFSTYDKDNSNDLSPDEVQEIYNAFQTEIHSLLDPDLIYYDSDYYHYFSYYFWANIPLTEKLTNYQKMQGGAFAACYKRPICFEKHGAIYERPTLRNFSSFIWTLKNQSAF